MNFGQLVEYNVNIDFIGNEWVKELSIARVGL